MNHLLLINYFTAKALELLRTMPDSDDDPILGLAEALTEIRRLRARILELEANAAITMGTLEKPTEAEPTRFEWNVPPSTPPLELP